LVDADGIKAIKDRLHLVHGYKTVLTPHPGEFKIISGHEVQPKWNERYQTAIQFAKTNECILLLKGHESIITNGSQFKINSTGNPGLATAGTGDVLSGIIGTYLAKKQDPYNAAVAGAWIHGKVGDFVSDQKGYHLVASDLVDHIPMILKTFDK
jgi:NAD(P)H-hydrate epimerase